MAGFSVIVDNKVRQTATIGTANCGTTSSVITVPAGGVPAGQTVIVQLSQREAAVGTITFTDSRGNTYTTDATVTGTRTRTVVASAQVTTALQGGDTITVTHPSGKNSIAYASSWAGIASTNRVAGSATATGSSTAPSATLSTTWSGTLVYGAATSKEHNTWTEASGFTTLDHLASTCTTNRADHHAAYRTTRSTGSITYNPTYVTAREWTVALVAYKEADRTPPDVPVLSGTAGDDETTLQWTAVTDASTPVLYRLYRDGTQIYDGTAQTYNDTAVSNGSSYSYTVRSYDALSNLSSPSAAITLSPQVGSSIRFRRTLGSVTCGTTSSTITVPAGGVPAGRTLVIRVAIREGATTAYTASDTRGNTYTVDHQFSSAKIRLATMSTYIATPLQAGDTITVTHPDSKSEAVSVLEFSGISATSRVGSVAGTTGTSTLPSATVATSSQRSVLVGAIGNIDPVTVTEPTSWNTQVHQQMNCGGLGTLDTHGAYRRVDTAGTYTYNPTLSASKEWVNVLVAYRGGDDTAPPTPTLTAEAGDAENFLSWTTVTDPSAPVTYHLLRDGAEVYSGTGTSFHDTGRTNGASYAYALYARDGVGNDSVTANATLTPLPSWSIHFVRSLGTVTCGNTSHVLTVPAGGVSAHHTVILQVSFRVPGVGAVTATDSKGNTYSVDADVTGSLTRTVVLSGYLTTALAAGDQITVTTPDAGSEGVGGTVFSGIAPSSRVDATGTASGTSVSPLASATTTQARTLVVGAVATKDFPTYTQPSGYTALDGVNVGCGANQNHRGGWKITTAAGAPAVRADAECQQGVDERGRRVPERGERCRCAARASAERHGWAPEGDAVLDHGDRSVFAGLVPALPRRGADLQRLADSVHRHGADQRRQLLVHPSGGRRGEQPVRAEQRGRADPDGGLDRAGGPDRPRGAGPRHRLQPDLEHGDGSDRSGHLPALPERHAGVLGRDRSYTDTGATPGATYTYTIRASDAVPNQSAASSGVTSAASVVTGPAIARSGAGVTGNITQGGDYYVYANATAGSATITATVNNLSAGETSVALVPGSYSVGPTTFTHRSAVMVADNPLSAGSKSFSVKPSGGTSVNGSVTVDNTAPTGTNVQTTNVSRRHRRPPGRRRQDPADLQRGDVGRLDPERAGTAAAPTSSSTSLNDGGDDIITFWNAAYTQQLPLGAVVGADPVSVTSTFGLTGTPSTMVRSGSVIEITLGSIDPGGAAKTTTGTKTLVWTPNATRDRQGRPAGARRRPVTESGPADADFWFAPQSAHGRCRPRSVLRGRELPDDEPGDEEHDAYRADEPVDRAGPGAGRPCPRPRTCTMPTTPLIPAAPARSSRSPIGIARSSEKLATSRSVVSCAAARRSSGQRATRWRSAEPRRGATDITVTPPR